MEMCKIKIKKGVVNVTSPYEENCPEYFEPKPTIIDNFKNLLKQMQ